MTERYDPHHFDDLNTELKQLETEPTEVSAYELITQHYDDIRAAVQRGVSLQRIHQMLTRKQLKIKFVTFRNYLTQIERERKKEERRIRRQAKKNEPHLSPAAYAIQMKAQQAEKPRPPSPEAPKQVGAPVIEVNADIV